MKVKELIAKLQKVDPELEVLLSAESIHEKFAIIGIGRLTQVKGFMRFLTVSLGKFINDNWR